MNLFKLSFRRSHRRRPPLPTWATETTTESAAVQREAEALVARSREHEWATINTGLLTAIRTGLRRSGSGTPSWSVVSGERVAIGDAVVIDLDRPTRGVIEDADPQHQLPRVRVAAGPNRGQLLVVTPGQILRRRQP